MKFACYTDWEQLPESADTLFEQAEKNNVFFSRSWFECITRFALDENHTLVLACVLTGDKVLAILPLMESTGNKTWYALKHGFTPLYSPLITDDTHYDPEQVLACLVQALSQLPIKGLLLEPVASDDSTLNRLQKLLESDGFSCEHIFRDYNWIYRLQGQSYAEYMAARPAQLRNTIARKKRKLEREHGYEIRLYKGDEIQHGMPDYYAVYNASWKQNEISNLDFQDCFIAKFSSAGYSRLAVLYIRDQPVAAQLWFVHNNKASIFRLAYNKAWRQYSTGSILTAFMMEHVIDTDSVNEIDFLTGNDAYKQDWMSERRERFLLGCVKCIIPTTRYERFMQALKHLLQNDKELK